MNQTTIDIKAESLPWQFRFFGVLLLIAGLAIIGKIWWLSIILWLIGLLLLTGHSGTLINREDKTYREYNSYLLMRNGEIKKYHAVEKVFINSSRESRRMYTPRTNDSSIFTNTVYNAYLKFDNGIKIYLTSRNNRDKLMKELTSVAGFLNTSVEDYS